MPRNIRRKNTQTIYEDDCDNDPLLEYGGSAGQELTGAADFNGGLEPSRGISTPVAPSVAGGELEAWRRLNECMSWLLTCGNPYETAEPQLRSHRIKIMKMLCDCKTLFNINWAKAVNDTLMPIFRIKPDNDVLSYKLENGIYRITCKPKGDTPSSASLLAKILPAGHGNAFVPLQQQDANLLCKNYTQDVMVMKAIATELNQIVCGLVNAYKAPSLKTNIIYRPSDAFGITSLEPCEYTYKCLFGSTTTKYTCRYRCPYGVVHTCEVPTSQFNVQEAIKELLLNLCVEECGENLHLENSDTTPSTTVHSRPYIAKEKLANLQKILAQLKRDIVALEQWKPLFDLHRTHGSHKIVRKVAAVMWQMPRTFLKSYLDYFAIMRFTADLAGVTPDKFSAKFLSVTVNALILSGITVANMPNMRREAALMRYLAGTPVDTFPDATIAKDYEQGQIISSGPRSTERKINSSDVGRIFSSLIGALSPATAVFLTFRMVEIIKQKDTGANDKSDPWRYICAAFVFVWVLLFQLVFLSVVKIPEYSCLGIFHRHRDTLNKILAGLSGILEAIPFASLLMSQMTVRWLQSKAADDNDGATVIGEMVALGICLIILVAYECFYRMKIVGWKGKVDRNDEPASCMRKVLGILANFMKAAMLTIPPVMQLYGTVTPEDKILLPPLVPSEPSEFNRKVLELAMPVVLQIMSAQFHLFCGNNLNN